MESLIPNGFVFVIIVIQPFLITCNSNRIEKRSHIVQPRTVREIPISGGRQSHRFRRASVIVQNKVLYFITYRKKQKKGTVDLSLIPLICSFSILTILDVFAMDSKGISLANKKTPSKTKIFSASCFVNEANTAIVQLWPYA